jgi:hypothetical protein
VLLASLLALASAQPNIHYPVQNFSEEYEPVVIPARQVSAKRPRNQPESRHMLSVANYPIAGKNKPVRHASTGPTKRRKFVTTTPSLDALHVVYDEPVIKRELTPLADAVSRIAKGLRTAPFEHWVVERARCELGRAIGKVARSINYIMSFTVGHAQTEFADRFEDMSRDVRLLLEKLCLYLRVRNGETMVLPPSTLVGMLNEGAGTNAKKAIQELATSPVSAALEECFKMLHYVLGHGNKQGLFCVHNTSTLVDPAMRKSFFQDVATIVDKATLLL